MIEYKESIFKSNKIGFQQKNILFVYLIFRSQGSFIDSSRLYVLQGALAQQEWRVGQLLNRLLSFLAQYLTHPYQVRTLIGQWV